MNRSPKPSSPLTDDEPPVRVRPETAQDQQDEELSEALDRLDREEAQKGQPP